jgi:carbon-monoxide dehydrogenase medium subunit
MREYHFSQPKNFDELFSGIAAARGAVKFVAGGTDFVPRLNLDRAAIPYEHKEALNIVYLGNLGLTGVKDKGKELVIGACVTLSELLENPCLGDKVPALHQALEKMAGLSVRNIATIGGNIMNASPAADSVPPLMVLEASFTLRSQQGERQIKAADFFTGPGKTQIKPGEILVSITVPYGKGSSAFEKLGRRQAETLSVVSAAAYIEAGNGVFKTVRLALGSVGPTVVVSKAVAGLAGKPVSEETVEQAVAAITSEIKPIDDVRSSAWYRNSVAPVIAKRAIMAATQHGGNGGT